VDQLTNVLQIHPELVIPLELKPVIKIVLGELAFSHHQVENAPGRHLLVPFVSIPNVILPPEFGNANRIQPEQIAAIVDNVMFRATVIIFVPEPKPVANVGQIPV
jgi:hypothetical protein